MFPIEIDLDMVRRQRETGMKGLGQVLKSFRDRDVDFSVYDRTSGVDSFLNTLGPLAIPHQGTRAGLMVDVPGEAEMEIEYKTPTGTVAVPPIVPHTDVI